MSKYVGFRLGKVHESHVISEYYCGGCGWPVTDHDSFCPECGGAFRECDASNLEDENAKLRELLQRALTSHNKMCTNRGTCAGCLLFNAKPFAPACPIVSVTRDARELSVEADG